MKGVAVWHKGGISPFVIPAQAGIQPQPLNWIPACAGMTIQLRITLT